MPPESAIALARQRLAEELGCAAHELQLISVEAVAWPDSALGCPQPGKMYMQVITPGYRIVLEHASRHYTLHTDRGMRAIRCNTSPHRRSNSSMQ